MSDYNPQAFQDLITGAAQQGWDWFEKADEATQKAMNVADAKAMEDNKAIVRAWFEFSETPGGRKALEKLFDTTLRRTTFFTQLGMPPDQVAAFGSFREGQNAFAFAIARCIAAGRGETLKGKDTDHG